MNAVILPILLALSGPAPAAASESEARRYALVVGANDGGPGRSRLRYATDDARRVAQVLVELGGVQPTDEVLLLEPRRGDLERAFADLDRRLDAGAGATRRREVVVYFSGHSDETGLLLGGDRYDYGDLRTAIRGLDADVRVAILDSCASGAIVRAKGGRVVPAFLVDESSDVAGHVFLTSSSADETSQEADRIASSFFTHALVTGLRGAADVDLDSQVTLTEAYRFAYDETLALTEATRRGAQHPAYDMALTGTGDLVMTDLHGTSASLALDETLSGRLFIRDGDDRLVAELYKPAGRPMALGLPPGGYEVTLERDGRLGRARIDLVDGSTESLASGDFEAFAGALHATRGQDAELRTMPLALQFVHDTAGEGERPSRHVVALGLVGAGAERLDGFSIASAYTAYPEGEAGIAISGAVNVSGPAEAGQVTGGANVVTGPFAGLQVAGGANIVDGPAAGVQVSGGLNVASEVDGAQVTGGLNVATTVHGVQVGPINVGGDVHGLQVGVVNICDHLDGVPIAVVTICRDGIFHGLAWTDDLAMVNAGVQVGSHRFYTLYGAAFAPPWDGQVDRLAIDAGAGVRLLTGRVDLDLDVYNTTVLVRPFTWDHTGQIVRVRLIAALPLTPRLAPFAGASIGLDLPDASRDPGAIFDGWAVHPGWDSRLRPGFVAGVRF
jgi:hypothetical protein